MLRRGKRIPTALRTSAAALLAGAGLLVIVGALQWAPHAGWTAHAAAPSGVESAADSAAADSATPNELLPVPAAGSAAAPVGLVPRADAPGAGFAAGGDVAAAQQAAPAAPLDTVPPVRFAAANERAAAAAAAGVPQAPPSMGPGPHAGNLVVNTAVAESVRPGALLQVVVRYTNTGVSALTNIVIDDVLSSGQAFDGTYTANPAIPGTNYSWTGLQMQWTVPSLAPGAAGVIQFQTTVDDRPEPTAQQPIRLVGNVARIKADGVAQTEDEAVGRVVGPIFELVAADGPDPVLPGHALAITLTLRNLNRPDSIAAHNIVISTVVPTELTFTSASSGGSYDPAKKHVAWNVAGPLAPGANIAVSYVGHVDPAVNAPTDIVIDADEIVARSAEVKVNDVTARGRNTTHVSPLLDKLADGPRAILRGATAYPGDTVTYTLLVHNPGDMPLASLALTDTLPGNPRPFEFGNMLSGAPPEIDGPNLRWTNLSLPAFGTLSFRYTARVPRNTFIADNSTQGTIYGSNVTAQSPDHTFPASTNVGQVRVYPPVVMEKRVRPEKVQAGDEVVYTITLQNRATFPVASIRLTDTMAGPLFRYVRMQTGPAPEAGLDTNPVVWTGLSVPPGGRLEVAFVAFASGWPLVPYVNNIAATSPDSSIPARTNQARVTIDSPLRIAKTVTPKTTIQNTTVRYDLRLTNVTTATYTLDRVTDTLPTGMFDPDTGRHSVSIINSPAAQIRPGETWQTQFDAYVSGDVECRLLPRSFPNARGMVEMQISSPEYAIYGNASDLAPLKVNPHVTVWVTPTRQSVLPGSSFIYNLRMKNASTEPGTNASFSLTIPEGYTYVSTLDGPAPEVVDRVLRWQGTQIAPLQDQTIRLQMQAGTDIGARGVDFDGSAEGIFCMERHRNKFPVNVRQDVILLETKAMANPVAPGGPVDLELRMRNYDPQPYPLTTVTDTLPGGFEFVSMVTGDAPSEVHGRTVTWHGIVLPPNGQLVWRLRARAPTVYGTYMNQLAGASAETTIRSVQSPPFNVAPMIQLVKEASRDTVPTGTTLNYTITLLNLSPATYSDIVVTDTLPAGLTYERMLVGPSPSELGPGRTQPEWRGLSINANGGTRTLVFEARVSSGAALGTVYNEVDGYSQSVAIPGSDNTAPITITQGAVPTAGPSPTPWPSVTPRATAVRSVTPGPSPTRGATPTRGASPTPLSPPTLRPGVTDLIYLPSAHRR